MKSRKAKIEKASPPKSKGRVRGKIVEQLPIRKTTNQIHCTPDILFDEIVLHAKPVASPAVLAKRIQRRLAQKKA